jgi:GNAT superfamily N-acetyltransferase
MQCGSSIDPGLAGQQDNAELRRLDRRSGRVVLPRESGALGRGFGLATADGELALLYVVPQVHGTGVGRALLAALETAGRRAGLTEFRLESTATAREFYVRNGFSSAGEPSCGSGIIGYLMRKAL